MQVLGVKIRSTATSWIDVLERIIHDSEQQSSEKVTDGTMIGAVILGVEDTKIN